MIVALIGVPFDGYGRSGNYSLPAPALRSAGLAAAVAGNDLASDTDLDRPEPDPRPGPASTCATRRRSPPKRVPDDDGEPGGPRPTTLVTATIGEGGCLGRSGVISDPRRDPAGVAARRTVAFTGAIVAAPRRPAAVAVERGRRSCVVTRSRHDLTRPSQRRTP